MCSWAIDLRETNIRFMKAVLRFQFEGLTFSVERCMSLDEAVSPHGPTSFKTYRVGLPNGLT